MKMPGAPDLWCGLEDRKIREILFEQIMTGGKTRRARPDDRDPRRRTIRHWRLR
jgi:hypothetical protein